MVVVVVTIVVPVVMMMIVVMTVIVARLEEGRLDVEDAVEVEGIAAEHLGQRYRATLGAYELWHKD